MNENLKIKVDEIESMIAANVEKIKEALKNGQKDVDELREELLSGFDLNEKYKFVLVNESTLKIFFETGEFDKNNRPVIVSLYFKYVIYEDSENKESFTINTWGDDSFDPTSENYLVDYYSFIGLFCSNKDVCRAIKEIMRKVYCKVRIFRDINFYLKNEVIKLKRENTKTDYKNHQFVLIQTNSNTPIYSHYIYKGKPVIILGYGSYMECYDNYFTNYKGTENKYEIVESKQIKC